MHGQVWRWERRRCRQRRRQYGGLCCGWGRVPGRQPLRKARERQVIIEGMAGGRFRRERWGRQVTRGGGGGGRCSMSLSVQSQGGEGEMGDAVRTSPFERRGHVYATCREPGPWAWYGIARHRKRPEPWDNKLLSASHCTVEPPRCVSLRAGRSRPLAPTSTRQPRHPASQHPPLSTPTPRTASPLMPPAAAAGAGAACPLSPSRPGGEVQAASWTACAPLRATPAGAPAPLPRQLWAEAVRLRSCCPPTGGPARRPHPS